jgi:hypothetical protein
MSFPKIGKCPFEGGHWPSEWPAGKNVTPKTFSSLGERQKLDLISFTES